MGFIVGASCGDVRRPSQQIPAYDSAVPQPHAHRRFAPFADDGYGHFIAGMIAVDGGLEIVGRDRRFAVDRHDQVGGAAIDRLRVVDEWPLSFCAPS